MALDGEINLPIYLEFYDFDIVSVKVKVNKEKREARTLEVERPGQFVPFRMGRMAEHVQRV